MKRRFNVFAKRDQIVTAIPATKAPSERVFRNAGLTISAKRAFRAPSNASEIIFFFTKMLESIQTITIMNLASPAPPTSYNSARSVQLRES